VKPRTWEVVDPDAVPREAMVISPARVERLLKSGDVPGIRRVS
jgi:hypothetical protein